MSVWNYIYMYIYHITISKFKFCIINLFIHFRLISHMKGHGTLSCLYCDYATPDYEIFQSHLKLCSEAQKLSGLSCRLCNHAFHNRKILADHMERLHGTALYTCDMCFFSSIDKEEFLTHSQGHLKIEVIDSNSANDVAVNTTNNNKVSISALQNLRTCSQCGEDFKNERKYEQHMMSQHKTSEVDFDIDGTFLEEKDGMYVCLLCSFETADKMTITAHIEHHKSKWFRCDVPDCSFVAATKKALSKHKVNSHLDLLQNASFTKAAPVSAVDGAHLYDSETGGLQGHGSGMWQCHICPDKTLYRYRRSYEKHMAKHKGFVEPSIEVQSHRIMPSFDPNALTCLMCGAQGWADRAQLQSHLLHAHGIDAFDHRDEESSSGSVSDHSSATAQNHMSASSSSQSLSAHVPRMSDAHMQMLRQIAVNAAATSPTHHMSHSASGPIAWPEPEEQSTGGGGDWPPPPPDSDAITDSKSDAERPSLTIPTMTITTKNGDSSGKPAFMIKSPSASGLSFDSAVAADMTSSSSQADLISPTATQSSSSSRDRVSSSSKRAPSEITRITSQQFDSSDSEDEAWPSEWTTSSAPKRLKTAWLTHRLTCWLKINWYLVW